MHGKLRVKENGMKKIIILIKIIIAWKIFSHHAIQVSIKKAQIRERRVEKCINICIVVVHS